MLCPCSKIRLIMAKKNIVYWKSIDVGLFVFCMNA